MPIPIICACSAKLKVGEHLQGKHVKCPKCGQLIPVGTPEAAPTPQPAAAPPSSEEVLAASSLSPEERQQVAKQLRPDERLVWADKPVPGSAFLRGCLVSVFLGFVGCLILGIAVGLAFVEQVRESGWFILVVMALMALGLLVCAAGLPFVLRWRTARTFYAFTTRRALAWPCDWLGRPRPAVYSPALVSGMHRMMTGGEVGDIVFATERVTKKTREGTEFTARIRRHGFFMIRRPDEVERLLREMLVDPYLDGIYS